MLTGKKHVLEVFSGIHTSAGEKKQYGKCELTSGRKLLLTVTHEELEHILWDEKLFRMFIVWAMGRVS